MEEDNETMEAAQKGGYSHFMLKEIHEQPKVAQDLIHLLSASKHLQKFVDKMKSARHLYFVGCGTSYHACVLGSVYLARLAGRPAVPSSLPSSSPSICPRSAPGTWASS